MGKPDAESEERRSASVAIKVGRERLAHGVGMLSYVNFELVCRSELDMLT